MNINNNQDFKEPPSSASYQLIEEAPADEEIEALDTITAEEQASNYPLSSRINK